MYVRAIALALVGVFLCGGITHAQMSSSNFQIRWDSVSAGGSDTSSSASYGLRDTMDPSASPRSSSASYLLDSGYRQGIFDEIITFDLLVQNSATVKVATAYGGGIISGDSDGTSVGDYVVLIQDRGVGQVAGIGKVTGIGIGSVMIDRLATAGVVPVIDGTNDYFYRLSGSALALGTLANDTIRTGIVAFQVTAENENGYVVQVLEDGNLRDGVSAITDVADGSVSVGSSEYGARSSDSSIATSTFDTQDSPLTASGQAVATSDTAAVNERTFLTLKAAVDGAAAAGAYGQVLTFIASGNF